MERLADNEKSLLTRMLVSHAYREKLAVERFHQALDFAPTAEDRTYIKQIVEEEASHYQGCLRAGKELQIDLKPLVEARMLREPHGLPPFNDWLDVLMSHSFNDRAGYFVIRGLVGSKISAYARLAVEIIAEEELHGANGAALLIDYYPICNIPDRRARLEMHLDASIRCLGNPFSQSDAEAVKMGLKTKPAAQIIEEYCQDVDPIMISLGCADLAPLVDRYLQPVS